MNIKKVALAVLVLCLGFSKMNAQENVVKFNPLAIIFGSFQVSYERVVSDNSSLQLDLGFTSFKYTSGFSEVKYTGFGAGAQYRFYLGSSNEPPVGFFAGPIASFSTASSDDFKVTTIVAGGIIGYQWNFDPITLDLYAGPAYYSVDADDPTFSFGFDGFGAVLGLSVGVAF